MQFVSFLFHPLLMPTFLFSILFWKIPEALSPISKDSVGYLILAIFITTFVIPVLSIATLKMTSSIKSFTLRNREDRIVPFLFIFCFYAITTYLFIEKIKINELIALMMITTSLLILALTLITTKYKISIHCAGLGGGVGYLVALSVYFHTPILIYPLAAFVIIAGLVASARLYLNAHTLEEVTAGSIFGFTFCFGSMMLFA